MSWCEIIGLQRGSSVTKCKWGSIALPAATWPGCLTNKPIKGLCRSAEFIYLLLLSYRLFLEVPLRFQSLVQVFSIGRPECRRAALGFVEFWQFLPRSSAQRLATAGGIIHTHCQGGPGYTTGQPSRRPDCSRGCPAAGRLSGLPRGHWGRGTIPHTQHHTSSRRDWG